jgi:hypothetical protein
MPRRLTPAVDAADAPETAATGCAVDPLRLLSVERAAKTLGISSESVRALLDRGMLAEHRLPGRPDNEWRTRYTSRIAIEAWLRRDAERACALVEQRDRRS